MKKAPSDSLQIIFCDWPFKITKAKWDQTGIDLQAFWTEAERILKPNGVVLAKCVFPFTLEVAASNPSWLRYDWVWEKTNATGFLNANRAPLRAHETILVFYSKPPVYNPQKTAGHKRKTTTRTHVTELYGDMTPTSYDSTERFPRSVLQFPSDKQKNNLVSTQTPVSLLEYFLLTYSNLGDQTGDFTCGSGSWGEACERTGRGYILVDNDPVKIEITNNRLRAK
jgi:site-specific DNA-methyltransferase (adenine-specific)